MILHAYDQELNYLGSKIVEKATIEAEDEFEQEILKYCPNAKISIDIEPEDHEIYGDTEDYPDLPF